MNIGFFLSAESASVPPDAPVSEVKQRLAKEKYLVVKDGDRYVGILSQADALRSEGTTVAECATEKPFVTKDRDVGEVLHLMLEHDYAALPIVDERGAYLGAISFDDIADILCGIVTAKFDINFTNVVGDDDLESAKQSFIAQMHHHIKNPIQVIYSALRLLQQDNRTNGQEILIHAIENNLRRIDLLMNDLSKQYLSAAQPR